MEQISSHDLMIALMLWKSKCEESKPEDHDCNNCELILKEVSRRLTFGEMDAALIKKSNIDPKHYLSVALFKAKEIHDKTENLQAKKFGAELASLFSKVLQSMEKNDLIKNLKNTKIDGKPS